VAAAYVCVNTASRIPTRQIQADGPPSARGRCAPEGNGPLKGLPVPDTRAVSHVSGCSRMRRRHDLDFQVDAWHNACVGEWQSQRCCDPWLRSDPHIGLWSSRVFLHGPEFQSNRSHSPARSMPHVNCSYLGCHAELAVWRNKLTKCQNSLPYVMQV